MSLSIFGNAGKAYNFFGSSVIQRRRVTTGIVQKSKNLIMDTIKIGLTPLYVNNEEYTSIIIKGDRIFAGSIDISEVQLTQVRHIIIWFTKKHFTNEF